LQQRQEIVATVIPELDYPDVSSTRNNLYGFG
jgi:hypothetical protein